jgi:hypothetical protein
MKGVVKFRATWRWSVHYCRDAIVGLTIVLSILVSAYLLVKGEPLSRLWDVVVVYSGPMLFGIVTLCALLLFLGYLVPVRATPDGIIAGLNGWGKRGLVKWSDIRAVAPMEMNGMRMLKLRRNDASTAYVALPLDSYADLAAFVEKHAGADNALARWLKAAKPGA